MRTRAQLKKATDHITAKEDRDFQGIGISIENPKGSVRKGVNSEGKEWQRRMHCDYGSVPVVTEGDGEDFDVYVGDSPDAPNAYLIEQLKDDGSFDEYKCAIGFDTKSSALGMYLKHYPDNWERDHVGNVYQVTVDELKEAIEEAQAAQNPEMRMLMRLSRCEVIR